MELTEEKRRDIDSAKEYAGREFDADTMCVAMEALERARSVLARRWDRIYELAEEIRDQARALAQAVTEIDTTMGEIRRDRQAYIAHAVDRRMTSILEGENEGR